MGSSPSTQENLNVHVIISKNQFQKNQQQSSNDNHIQTHKKQNFQDTKKQSSYGIPELEMAIKKANLDLNSKDPIGKKRYFFQVVNFIFQWLHHAMHKGMTLYDAQCMVHKDLLQACKDYPIGTVTPIQSSIKDKKPVQMPNLLSSIEKISKQTFTDRIRQVSLRSKEVSYQFNKQMQIILEKQGGFKFKGGFKNTGIKAYMRILTKILQPYLSSTEGSRQVYTDMDHYYWTPIFIYFNKLIDQNIQKLKVEVYDWIRCRVFYKNIQDLEQAYKRLESKFGADIFRVKNRINTHTRDVLINLKYKTQYAEIQLALKYDSSACDFNHKLYELTREKLGVAYCSFTILLNEVNQDESNTEGVMTVSGYIKKATLRQKVEDGFQRLERQDAEKEWESVKTLLRQWDVIALKSGKIRGRGFQSQLIDQPYGPQISQMMIIKRRSEDYESNWLNWMQQ